jgi:hypothetical protein
MGSPRMQKPVILDIGSEMCNSSFLRRKIGSDIIQYHEHFKYGPCPFRIAKPSTRNTTTIHRHAIAMGPPASEPYFHDNA